MYQTPKFRTKFLLQTFCLRFSLTYSIASVLSEDIIYLRMYNILGDSIGVKKIWHARIGHKAELLIISRPGETDSRRDRRHAKLLIMIKTRVLWWRFVFTSVLARWRRTLSMRTNTYTMPTYYIYFNDLTGRFIVACFRQRFTFV